jgi:hypothetical protein
VHRRRHRRHSVYRIRIDDSFPIDVYSDPSLSGAERRKTAEMYVETLNHGFGECTRRRLADFLAELNSGCGPIRISRAAPQSLLRSSASFSNRMISQGHPSLRDPDAGERNPSLQSHALLVRSLQSAAM